MQLLVTRHSWWAAQCEAVLAAEGVPAFWQDDPDHVGVLSLEVSAPFADQAVALMSAQLNEDMERQALHAQAQALHVDAPFFLRPAVATGFGVAVFLLVFYAVTGGVADHSPWLTHGAFVRPAVLHGEWWRFVTAATLHADVPHVLGNAAFFVMLCWAAGEHLGSGVALGVWLVTAVLGFAASLALSDANLTVGASGGLFGLLGAAAGHALRWPPPRPALASRRRLEVFGSAALFLAFTAFSREANIEAHVGGAVAGLAVGLLAGRALWPAWVQRICALIVALVLVLAWAVALGAGHLTLGGG